MELQLGENVPIQNEQEEQVIRLNPRKYIPCFFALICILYTYITGNLLAYTQSQYLFVSFEIIVSTIVLSIEVNEKYQIFYNGLLFIFICIFTSITLDLFNNSYSYHLDSGLPTSTYRFVISVFFVALIYCLFISICGRLKLGLSVGFAGFVLGGFISYIVNMLRGSRLVFSDLKAFSTAIDVIGGYSHLPVNKALYLGIISCVCTIALLIKIVNVDGRKTLTQPIRLLFFMIFAYGFFTLYHTGFENSYYSWDEDQNPYLYDFIVNAKLLNLEKQRDYDIGEIEDTLKNVDTSKVFFPNYSAKKAIEEKFPDYVKATGSTDPNVIVIMNESLTDLSIFGDLPIKEEIMPYMSSLGGIKGNLFTEVRGGGTADSEYTFLTGNSTLNLPSSARPYQLYVTEDSASIVDTFNTLDYQTLAIHPSDPTAWDRDEVYEDFGFDEFISGSSFEDAEYLRAQHLKSDKSTYEALIKAYEDKPKDKPLFAFDVTIQNHGGYTLGYENLQELQFDSYVDPEIIEFASLVRASDTAFGELIEYFKKVKEPTLILMFGDHQPNFESNFLTEQLGVTEDEYTIQDYQLQQETPYVIWANYNLPNQQLGDISINYLATVIKELTGIPKTNYDYYLTALYDQIKVIDKKGIITADGEYYSYSEKIPAKYQKLINQYKNILYYNMIDQDQVDPTYLTIQKKS